MHRHFTGRRLIVVGLVAAAAALVVPASASAHARVSPPVVLSKTGQIFSLAVPTEEANSATTKIEFTPPSGFSIDSFVPSPGWHREVESTGSGDSAVVTKVTWTGGSVPTGEDAFFQFLAQTDSNKTYTFGVRQTYSDGKVVDWSGSESSDTPSPTIKSLSSIGGGNSTLVIIALVLGAIGIVLGIVALLSGRRSLA
jgi:uncharacterized protein YcnI